MFVVGGSKQPKTSRRMLVDDDHIFAFETFEDGPQQESLNLPFLQGSAVKGTPHPEFYGPQQRQESFSQDLFNSEGSKKVRNTVLNLPFFQGMVKGTLHPEIYGGYMVQDAAYCFQAVKSYETAAETCQQNGSPAFALLLRVYLEKFKSYNQEFVQTWKLKNSESVEMGPAAAMYAGYEASLSRQDPGFLPIAMLPCQMLWPWIAGELITSVKEDNPYYVWFDSNKPHPSGKKSTVEKFVDFFFKPGDKGKAQKIFLEGMVNELNFFSDACGGRLYYYSDFQA